MATKGMRRDETLTERSASSSRHAEDRFTRYSTPVSTGTLTALEMKKCAVIERLQKARFTPVISQSYTYALTVDRRSSDTAVETTRRSCQFETVANVCVRNCERCADST